MDVFDHFYPNSNIWIIKEPKKGVPRKIKKEGDNVYWINPEKDDRYLQLIINIQSEGKIDYIVCHGLSSYYLETVKLIKSKTEVKIYWIFWGYELYRSLGYSGKMKLIDHDSFLNPLSYLQPTKPSKVFWFDIMHGFIMGDYIEKLLLEFINYADYFCFWLYGDYELLQKFYPCKAKFKRFQYSAKWKNNTMVNVVTHSERYFDKVPHTVMINHQSSNTGNHVTVLDKLKSLTGIDDFEITVPLSYGSNMIRRVVCWKGKRYFGDKFHPVLGYMKRDKYYDLIGRIDVAIFGQLRQEAGGNISFLLANGTKVFLRENNVLYQHFKNRGYHVYSFENDLNSIESLNGLSLEQKRENAKVAMSKVTCYEDYMPELFKE